MLMGVCPVAMTSGVGLGMASVSSTNATDINICIDITHQRLVLIISTNGLQNGLMVHGR